MPLYDYKCSKCGHIQEQFVSSFYQTDDDEYTICSECNLHSSKRIPSAHGGYKINGNNSASTRPKGAGSRSKNSK